ncbi:MAG: alpha/beta hydrolase [Cryptosporangiaceae bacterium]|nr:alpha/beta hydrolase [Cryptosporangiaceae bacterium]
MVAGGPEDAPPVVVLHGSGSNAARWRGEIAGWARHRRGYAVDVIGEPGPSAPSRPPMGTEAYALWLDDVLRALSLSRVAMVGESLGGWLALDYAARRPERVTRLAVLNPGGVGRQRIGVLLKAILLRPLGRRRTLLSMLGPAARDGVRDTAPGRFALLGSGHFRYRRQRFPVFDDATLRRLTMPVLAILGGREALLDSRQTARRFPDTVPTARVQQVPGAGHLLPDRTDAVLDVLTGSTAESRRA